MLKKICEATIHKAYIMQYYIAEMRFQRFMRSAVFFAFAFFSFPMRL